MTHIALPADGGRGVVLSSVGANIAGAHPSLGARIVAGWPALALLLVVEMLSRAGKSGQMSPATAAEPVGGVRPVLDPVGQSGGVRDFGRLGPESRETKVGAMTRVFHDVVAAGRMPDHRELARAAGADVSHARRVHRRLVAQQSG